MLIPPEQTPLRAYVDAARTIFPKSKSVNTKKKRKADDGCRFGGHRRLELFRPVKLNGAVSPPQLN
jgi:hypothetical protein